MSDADELLRQSAAVIQSLERRLQASKQARNEPIAIIGIGCRFPGGGHSPEAFWQALDAGVDGVSQVPADRWPLPADISVEPAARAIRWGAFVPDVRGFDASFFGISPREAKKLDPQQRLLLEVTWEALEDAGVVPERLHGARVGVYVGIMTQDYADLCRALPDTEIDIYVGTGNGHCFPPGRLAYTLGLRGPALAVDTACSSSLVAVHLACQALRNGECDMALVAGVNLMLSPATTSLIAKTQALSPDGRCRTFDAGANGYVRGEGCGVVVLQRAGDAVRGGSSIRAQIRGSAVNQDGRSNGLTVPNVDAQEAVVTEALRRAGVGAQDIGYVECHGTGTSLGDPIECEALALALGRRPADNPCVLGALKTNIGHLEAAAGIAGLIKSVLAFEHGRIPANLHFKTLNPRIAHGPWIFPSRSQPWPPGAGRRMAGVSAFSMSGTNAHVILEEAPAPAAIAATPSHTAELIVVSARTETALQEAVVGVQRFLASRPDVDLSDLARALATTRAAMERRLALVVSSREELDAGLAVAARGTTPPGGLRGTVPATRGELAWLFTGQGAQRLGMGRALHGEWPAFRDALDAAFAAFEPHLELPLRDVMWADEGAPLAAQLHQTEYTQPALFAVEWALAALWRAWGIEPAFVAGHSIGEIAAAAVAGILSLSDAAHLVSARGRLMQALPAGGAMVALAAGVDTVEAALTAHGGDLSIAAINGPEAVVVAGGETAVRACAEEFACRGVRASRLNVSHAFHSSLMDPMLEEFRRVAAALEYRSPSIPIVSNVRGRLADEEIATPEYWVRHARGAVRFADGVSALYDAGVRVFIEIGPRPVLSGLARACLPGRQVALLPSLSPEVSETAAVLHALGGWFVQGGTLDGPGPYAAGGRRLALPTYPWQRISYWLNSGSTNRPRAGTGHPWLNVATESADPDLFVWSGALDLEATPWLAEHRVAGAAILPGTGFAELMLWAATQVERSPRLDLTDLTLRRALVLKEGHPAQIQVIVKRAADSSLAVSLHGRSSGESPWHLHAAGRVSGGEAAPPAARFETAADQLPHMLSGTDFYAAWSARGNDWGPTFQRIERLWFDGHRSIVRVRGDAAARGAAETEFFFHPALADACAQGLAVFADDRAPGAFVGRRLRKSRHHAPLRGGDLWVHIALVDRSVSHVTGDIRVIDDRGMLIWEGEGLQIEFLTRDAYADRRWLYRRTWVPIESARESTSGRWLFVGSLGALRAPVQASLARRGVVAEFAADGDWPAIAEAVARDDLLGASYVAPSGPDGEEDAVEVDRVAATVQEATALLRQVLTSSSRAKVGWITTGVWAVLGTECGWAGQAALWGLGSSCSVEHAGRWAGLIDLPDGDVTLDAAALDIVAERLADAILGAAEPRLALRPDAAYAARLVELHAAADPAGPRLRTDAAYLITGGLGGLGLQVAAWLAGRGARHLILIGRSGVPPRTRWRSLAPGTPAARAVAAIRALEARGVVVHVAAVDVADRAALAAWLALWHDELRPPICGVVHAAGVVQRASVLALDSTIVREHLRPKFAGARALEAVLAEQPLEFFVSFASAASVVPSPELGAYAAANACLDVLAERRRRARSPALSISWGPWAETGMLADAGAEAADFRVMATMQSEAALEQMAVLWAGEEPCPAVLPIDWQEWARHYRSLLSDPLFTVFSAPREAVSDDASDPQSERAALAQQPPDVRGAWFAARLSALVGELLGYTEPLAPDCPIARLGIDSLTMYEIRTTIARRWEVDIPILELVQCRTIEEIAALIAANCVESTDRPSVMHTREQTPTQVEFISRDGMMVYGHLSLPNGPGPHPAIVVHTANEGGALDMRGQYTKLHEHPPLVSAGFAVLTVDQRGAPGHGHAYLRRGDIGAGDVDDLVAAAAYLVARSDIDASRIGILGTSRGAFAASLALARAPDLWRAGVLRMGFFDPIAYARHEQKIRPHDSPILRCFPDLGWEGAFALFATDERRPLVHLGAVRARLFVLHGDADRVVEPEHSRQLVEAARARGLQAELRIVPGLSHDIHELNSVWPVLWQEIVEFLNASLTTGSV